jgi:hypothetical protein
MVSTVAQYSSTARGCSVFVVAPCGVLQLCWPAAAVCNTRLILLLPAVWCHLQDIEGVWIDGRLAVVQARPQVTYSLVISSQNITANHRLSGMFAHADVN